MVRYKSDFRCRQSVLVWFAMACHSLNPSQVIVRQDINYIEGSLCACAPRTQQSSQRVVVGPVRLGFSGLSTIGASTIEMTTDSAFRRDVDYAGLDRGLEQVNFLSYI